MARHRQPLPPLSIPPSLNMQQPMMGGYDRGQPMFSPALPSSIQQSYHPPFPMNNSMQTPMQPFFAPQPPNAPGRPSHHHAQSMAHLAAAGIHPPNGFPITPVGGHFSRPSMMLGHGGQPFAHPGQQHQQHQQQPGGGGGGPPFPNRNRRQLSIGGPPKAVLGGPSRKVSPMPVIPAVPAPAQKVKKVNVNLPKETIRVPTEGGREDLITRPTWARVPLDGAFVYKDEEVIPVEVTSGEVYPPDSDWKIEFPGTVDVFLPGKHRWEDIKQRAIEEKLEKLGVERGSGSNVPHIHAPHARAASISSPADPALLLFKLNKLQASQEALAASLPASPQPPFGLSPSPHQRLPRFFSGSGSILGNTNRHGHSMSLAQPPSYGNYQPPSAASLYDPLASAFNPFGPNATLGGDHIIKTNPGTAPVAASAPVSSPPTPGEPAIHESIYAPQGRIPVSLSSLAPPLSAVRPDSRPDFTRGFGLDIPEEEEEEEEQPRADPAIDQESEGPVAQSEGNNQEESFANDADASQDMDLDEKEEAEGINTDVDEQYQEDRMGVVEHQQTQSRLHSRHVSKISAALSLRSVGGVDERSMLNTSTEVEATHSMYHHHPYALDASVAEIREEDLEDAVEEWTGSDDVYVGAETSDDESIGEFSNPSDEERARQSRVERRMHRKAASQQIEEKPRRLPNFPRPPDNTVVVPRATHDDDIISNPSEEDRDYLGVTDSGDYYPRPPSNLSTSVRPLPPLPHSRVASGQYSIHDPAHAHSRAPSENSVYPSNPQQQYQSRRDSLNPFAKPFVFGATRGSPGGSGSWEPMSATSTQTPPGAPVLGHTRLPSIGRPLNIAAPEFKPSGFTFRPPPGGPQMPIIPLIPEFSRPLPEPPIGEYVEGSPFKVQGREKRQRRASTASVEEGDSMTSFRFPANIESPQSIRHTSSPRAAGNRSRHSLNPSAEPFTFAGFSAVANLPYVPKASDSLLDPELHIPVTGSPEDTLQDDSTARAAENDEARDEESSSNVLSSKPRRAPIPLDFRHPVSSNTVPAGLFKALVNGTDERTRRAVRSRLSSREIFEHMHRPSMDDLDVPTIANRVSRSRLVTDPGNRQGSPVDPVEDVFSTSHHSHHRRRSSLPDALHDDLDSDASGPARDLTRRMKMLKFEERIEALLDEKLTVFFRNLTKTIPVGGQVMNPSTETMIADVVSLFRTQLQDSAARNLEDSQMDARGEMDFQLLKDVVEQGHKESLTVLKHELDALTQQLWQAHVPDNRVNDVMPIVEQGSNRTISAVVEAISDLSARLEAISRVSAARERDAVVGDLMNALSPVFSSLRAERVDYDLLTNQLTQAVKPHISQLIDLASDKRETANLIVDRILPLLPSIQAPAVDTESLTLSLITEVRRAIAPIDAFEIKEQVADLVVERLDSRLAVRDKTFNVDTVTSKVTEGIAGLLAPLERVKTTVDGLVAGQDSLSTQQGNLSSGNGRIAELVSELPVKLDSAIEVLHIIEAEIRNKLGQPAAVAELDENIIHVKSSLEGLAGGQEALAQSNDELLTLQKDVAERLATLPDSLLVATNAFQDIQADMLASRESTKREMEELRRLNTDYQIQVTKARGAHGQVRVEKDVLSEKLSIVEGDRDRLRGQVKELQTTAATKAAETATLETRTSELEEALAQALARLQSSDVATQAHQQRTLDLEKANRDLSLEKQSLKSKVDSLDLQVTLVTRDKESAVQALDTLQQQHDVLLSQQSHWDDLRETSQKIDLLTTLIGQADNEELKDLRRYRDRTKMLESEYATLQKRLKDQESKATNSDRAASAARQSLTQAQQRSSEWEHRAKEYEGQLEMTQTKLDQAEQTQAQLDADYSLIQLQLEEREADDRLTKDRENKLRDQLAALEAKVALLQAEIEQAKAPKTPTPIAPPLYRNPLTNGTLANGKGYPPRPDSRASTVFGDRRSVTPSMRVQSQTSSARSATPPSASVWDSMHAPPNAPASSVHAPRGRYPNLGPGTPKARRPPPQQYTRPAVPSPTPSTVSLAPTQDGDGWWS